MINLTELVDYDLAKLLDNKIWNVDRYAAEDEKNLVTDGENILYFAPTYAQVISYLDEYYGIVIDFQPVFTFSTYDHIAYFYKVYRKNDNEGRLDLLIEEKEWMSSFKLAVKTIVNELIERRFIKI